MKFIYLLIYSLFLALSFHATRPAYAIAPTLSISPTKFDLKIEPGQLSQADVNITNKSEAALPVTVEIMDFAPKDQSGAISYGVSLPGKSAKDWLHVNNKDLLLEPNQKVPIKVSINPPENTPEGSYFAVVMFQASLPSSYIENTGGSTTAIVPWVGTLFLLTIGDPKLDDNALKISSYHMPRFSTKSEVPITVDLTNNSSFYLVPSGEIAIRGLNQKVVATTILENTSVMPGTTRTVKGVIKRQSPFGIYKASAAFRYKDWQKNTVLGKFYLLTWIGSTVVCLFMFVIFLLIRHKKVALHWIQRNSLLTHKWGKTHKK